MVTGWREKGELAHHYSRKEVVKSSENGSEVERHQETSRLVKIYSRTSLDKCKTSREVPGIRRLPAWKFRARTRKISASDSSDYCPRTVYEKLVKTKENCALEHKNITRNKVRSFVKFCPRTHKISAAGSYEHGARTVLRKSRQHKENMHFSSHLKGSLPIQSSKKNVSHMEISSRLYGFFAIFKDFSLSLSSHPGSRLPSSQSKRLWSSNFFAPIWD